MARRGRSGRAEELAAGLLGRVGHAALYPDLIDRLAPAREHADAVATRDDLVEVLVEREPAEALEDALADLVGGLDVECDARDRAERAEPDDQSVEVWVPSRHSHELAARGHDLEPRYRRREVSVAGARAVGRGRDRARDGDVRQRGEVVQGDAAGVERRGELAD